MSDTKITDLTSAGTLDGTELFPVAQSGASRRLLLSGVSSYVIGEISKSDIDALNVDADTLDGFNSSQAATSSTVAVRDGNADLFGRYLNTSHTTTTRSSDSIFYSSTDNYIRRNTDGGMRDSLNVPTRTGGDASGTWGISITGNSDTATTLATSRTISLGGDLSGSASFDCSSNITITASVADDSHNHIISNIDGLQSALDAANSRAKRMFFASL